MENRRSGALVLLLSCAAVMSCGGGSTSDVMAPAPSIYAGEWQDTQTANPGCGFSGGTLSDHVETKVSGNQLTATVDSSCTESKWTLSENVATRTLTQDRTVSNGNGNNCTYTSTLNETLTFTTADEYFMQATQRRTYKSGDCSSFPIPCEISGTASGTRCQDCFEGCSLSPERQSTRPTQSWSLFGD